MMITVTVTPTQASLSLIVMTRRLPELLVSVIIPPVSKSMCRYLSGFWSALAVGANIYSQVAHAWWMASPSPLPAARARLHGKEGSRSLRVINPRRSSLMDWVVENLESSSNCITSSSKLRAGENDTLPLTGLVVGKSAKQVRILPAEVALQNETDGFPVIRLLLGRNGWGTGVHPTTRMCCEWVCQTLEGGETFLDYGTGSGILSIAALHYGARRSVGVDIEAEALVTAERNLQMNGYESDRYELLHTRQIIPFDPAIAPGGADLCVANILIGQLVRPSMVAALVTNLRPLGLLCFSGIRPDEVDALRSVYDQHFDWLDHQYAELSAAETPYSIESYGFDCGCWARLVGRKRSGTVDVEALSELAVS